MKLLAHQYRQAALLRQSQPAMGREIAVIERGEGRNGPGGGLSTEKLSFSQAERNLLPLEATRDDRRSKDSDQVHSRAIAKILRSDITAHPQTASKPVNRSLQQYAGSASRLRDIWPEFLGPHDWDHTFSIEGL